MIIDNQFVLRTPLYPINQKTVSPFLEEAFYIASPDFYTEYIKYKNDLIKDVKEKKKLKISLYKYQTRSKTRCTPFGLFAGISIGNFGNENAILYQNNTESIERITRLDMNVLCSLIQILENDTEIKPYLKFYPNNSLYKIGNYYRYIEYYYLNTRRVHKLSKVDYSIYLEKVLNAATNGKTLTELTEILVDDEITKEEAFLFISEIQKSQLIISEFEPTVTGKDLFLNVIEKLLELNLKNPTITEKWLNTIYEIRDGIKDLDCKKENDISSYKNIYDKVKLLLPQVLEKNLFQVDLLKRHESIIVSEKIGNTLVEVTKFLNKITPLQKNSNLEQFKKRFQDKYENQELPLSFVLDPESGLGYLNKDASGINPLVDDVFYSFDEQDSKKITWNAVRKKLLELLLKSQKDNSKVLKISEEDFSEIDFSKNTTLPNSMGVMFKILNSVEEKIEYVGCGGSSAINLLGRFTSASTELLELVEKIVKKEEESLNENSIYAEIVHLPENRVGNVLFRESFRKHEIPFLAKSSVEKEDQIQLSDLLISIRNGYIFLRSKKLNKQIIPKLGNAHNYSFNSLPTYHFLCDLQNQYFNKNTINFTWGFLEQEFKFLPRVEFKNVVLSPAKWNFSKNDYLHLINEVDYEKSETEYLKFIKQHELPDRFLIAEGDNELLIDLNTENSMLVFGDYLKNKSQISIKEFLFDNSNNLIKNNEGGEYANEFIAILYNNSTNNKNSISPKEKTSNIQRDFILGSEWLYYKIYCGIKTADIILTDYLLPILIKLKNEKNINKWFFIRYSDSDNHIRLRLNLTNVSFLNLIINEFNEVFNSCLAEKIVYKIQTDTYSREIERYGSNSIELSEQLFYYDSCFILSALSLLDIESGNAIRWKIAIRCVDQLLDDFSFSENEKYELLNRLSNSFFNEHGGGKNLKLQLDKKYRDLKNNIADILNKDNDESKEYIEVLQLLNSKSTLSQGIATQLISLDKNFKLEVKLNDIISSFLHMTLNRLFMGKQRTNEFVVYDLLARYYKSLLARNKKVNLITQ